MSKSKKSNKKNKTSVSVNKKNKANRKKAIISAVAFPVLVVVIGSLIFSMKDNSGELVNTRWISTSAVNASGDEVEMAEVYNSVYSTYQGSLSFRDDNTFSLWLTPGAVEDGTHTGKYSIEDDTISASFDDGETNTSFYIHRKDGKIEYISLYYEDYEVYFTSEN